MTESVQYRPSAAELPTFSKEEYENRKQNR